MSAKRNEPQEEKQKLFFDTLMENDGNIVQAGEVAGYSARYSYKLAYKYQDYLLNRINGSLLLDGVKAATIFRKILSSPDPVADIPGAELKMKAGTQVLDRIGVSKKDQIVVDVKSSQGIFFLPKKDIEAVEQVNDDNSET